MNTKARAAPSEHSLRRLAADTRRTFHLPRRTRIALVESPPAQNFLATQTLFALAQARADQEARLATKQ